MNTTALFPRKRILTALGYTQNASRSSWSHDDGARIFFDAWTNRYAPDGRYPMCTLEAYPHPDERGQVTVGGVTESARRGHVMWLAHLDLVLGGQRQAVLINPVPREAGPRQGEKGAKGWIPRYSTGVIVRDNEGAWFVPEQIITLDLDKTVQWPKTGQQPQRVEDRRTPAIKPGGDPNRSVKALLERHLTETRELLRQLG
jgi:hypothetical protein